MSQRQLALGICTPAYVSRLEKGERIPSFQLLRRLAERLGADADELAAGTPAPSADPLLDAELALRLDEVDEAERRFEAALDADSPLVRARATAGLGQVAFRRGDHGRALRLLEEVRDACNDDASVTEALGRAYATVGRLGDAISTFDDALREADARIDLVESLRFRVLLASACIDAGDQARAASALESVLMLTEGWIDPAVRARLWWSQSRIHQAQGESNLAARYARLALATLDTAEHSAYAARAQELHERALEQLALPQQAT